MGPTAKPGKTFVIYLLFCFLIAAAVLVYPFYVIRPFRHQGPRELMVALAVLRYRPFVVMLCALGSVGALIQFWPRETRVWRRVAAVTGVVVVAAVAWLTRINIYELMFHPFDRPSFSDAANAKFDGDEMVIAVNVGKAARAYPIRIISYHHIVNDVVDGVPIAATY